MNVTDLLAEHGVDPNTLEPAPAEPAGKEFSARIARWPLKPCSVCGDDCRTAQVLHFPEYGHRWVDLCRNHSLATWQPAPRMPSTVEGIIADLREVAAEVGAPLTILIDDDVR